MAELHRTFIAIELSSELRQAIAAAERQLEEAGLKLHWTKPTNLHFTLKFLGEIPLAQVAKAKIATREAAAEMQPFTVSLASLGAFPSVQQPRVVWVGVDQGREALQTLADRLDGRLAHYRFSLERRPFQPHLTLARIRDARAWGDLVRALGQFKDIVVGSQQVETVAVMESQLTPQGSQYTRVEEVRLGAYEK